MKTSNGVRILIFSIAYYPYVGGAEVAVKEITDRLSSLDWDMITLNLDKKSPDFEKIGNINVYRIGGSKFLFPINACIKAAKLHKKNNYDLTWSIMANRAGFAALFFKLFHPKIKFLLTLQEGDPLDYPKKRMGVFYFFLKSFFKAIFTRANYIQAISNYLAEWAKNMGAKCPIEVIPNGADTNLFKKIENIDKVRSKLEAPLNYIWLITTSRLVEKNGVEDIIKALQYLDKNYKLHILGTGPLEEKLKKITKNLKLENRVKFLGQKDLKDIPEFINISKIFIRPSLSEGMGNSFIEAMATGVPVIGTRVGGIPDFLHEGKTGLFCEVNNPESIAKKVMEYMNDPERTDKIIENAQKMVKENYDWNLIADKMKNIFEKMPAQGGSAFGGKVLICTGIYPPDIGGPATYSKLLYDEMPKHGISIKILSFGKVRRLPKVIRHIVYFFKILLKSRDIDVIYAQDPVSVGLPSVLAAKILRKKFILKVVGDYAWEQFQNQISNLKSQKFITLEEFQEGKYNFMTELRRNIERWVAKNADKIIVPSGYLKKVVTKWGIDEKNIIVIYNAFDAQGLKMTKRESRDELNLSGTILISSGRLVPWKGFGALIDIMPEVLKEIPDARLYIIGSGSEEKNFKFQISNLKIGDNVFLVGGISREKLLTYLRACDIFVLNSGYEGFSHLILEAMALGVPVIASNIGGNTEIIRDGENGILIEYNAKEDLKNKIISLYNEEFFREKLIKNAKESVKKFSKEKMINDTIKILS